MCKEKRQNHKARAKRSPGFNKLGGGGRLRHVPKANQRFQEQAVQELPRLRRKSAKKREAKRQPLKGHAFQSSYSDYHIRFGLYFVARCECGVASPWLRKRAECKPWHRGHRLEVIKSRKVA